LGHAAVPEEDNSGTDGDGRGGAMTDLITQVAIYHHIRLRLGAMATVGVKS